MLNEKRNNKAESGGGSEQRHMLHPLYIIYINFQIIQSFLPLIILLIIRDAKWLKLSPLMIAIGAALVVFALAMSYMEWKRFGYWLQEDRIIIRKGIFFRDEKTIYYSRIHSVNVQQKLIHRLLGLAQVAIETPGGGKKGDGSLPALSLRAANDISAMLRSRKQSMQKKQELEATDVTAQGDSERPTREAPKDHSSKQPDEPAAFANIEDSQERSFGNEQAAESISTIKNSQGRSIGNQQGAGSSSAFSSALITQSDESSVKLTPVQLMQAAASSLNFGLALAFIAGIYSFANNVIELLLPAESVDEVLESSSAGVFRYGVIVITMIILLLLIAVWLLSIALYVLKYSGFTINKQGSQLFISYGLLEKKTFLINPKKVQAVIMKESLLRQPFGFCELQLQIVSTDKQEQLTMHPFIHRSKVAYILQRFVPQLTMPAEESLLKAPRRALINYIRVPLIITLAANIALIAIFQWYGAWSLLLLPFIYVWRLACHKSAGLLLKDGQLTFRWRVINRVTCSIRRPQIMTMKTIGTAGQRRKKLISLSANAMGSSFAYHVKCMDDQHVQPIWRWYSRSNPAQH